VKKNGDWPGTDEDSKLKRKQTMIDRFGLEHNWIGKYGERNCDKTTLELYGKTSAEMLSNYIHFYGKKTDIESIFEEFLIELNIPYQIKFRIYDKNKINFWFREYDFLLLGSNILIEVDGDYWHGNKNLFEELSDFQKSVQENDKIKEDFAVKNGYKIVRFWEEDIKNKKEEVKNKIKKL
jgi:very-short-patch-repair endonuclease